MVTTKQKPTVDSQKIKRRESKHTTMENHQFTKEGSKRGRKEQVNSKIARKHWHALVSPYLSIITVGKVGWAEEGKEGKIGTTVIQ